MSRKWSKTFRPNFANASGAISISNRGLVSHTERKLFEVVRRRSRAAILNVTNGGNSPLIAQEWIVKVSGNNCATSRRIDSPLEWIAPSQ